MRKTIPALLLIMLVITGCASKKDPARSQSYYDTVYGMIKEKDFFTARDTFKVYEHKIEPPYNFILQANLDNVFNKLESSNEKIDLIFKEYSNSVPDKIKLELLEIEQANYGRLFEYEKASDILEVMLEKYLQLMDKEIADDHMNTQLIWDALSGQPKQEVIVTQDTSIKMIRDKAQLTNLKVEQGSTAIDFIFDTGANFSTVTQTTAQKLHMKIFDTTIEVGAITGLSVKSQLAVCPEFSIGGIVVKNAVFLVFPDEALAFPEADYHINGIIGYPVIEALKEIQITRQDEFIVPKKPTDHKLRNMALDFLNPVIDINGEYYTFDSGAVGTSLYKKYIDKYHDSIVGIYEEKELELGGAGGMLTKKGYSVVFSPVIEGRRLEIKDVDAYTEKIAEKENSYYGNIGQDVIKQFEKMTLNFEYMYIKFD